MGIVIGPSRGVVIIIKAWLIIIASHTIQYNKVYNDAIVQTP